MICNIFDNLVFRKRVKVHDISIASTHQYQFLRYSTIEAFQNKNANKTTNKTFGFNFNTHMAG